MRKCGKCNQPGHYQSTCSKQSSVTYKEPASTAAESKEDVYMPQSASDFVPTYRTGLWLINPENNKIAGKITRVTKETIIYNSMLGAVTESSIRDVANSNYLPLELEPAHLLKFAVMWKK